MGMKVGLGKTRERFLKQELAWILEKLKELHPVKIILFGSLNEKNVGRSSDIDIAIIKDTDKRFTQRLDEIYEKITPNIAVDFFVYTPQEIKKHRLSNIFIRRILERGTVIYEA